MRKNIIPSLVAVALAGCLGSAPTGTGQPGGNPGGNNPGPGNGNNPAPAPGPSTPAEDPALAARTVDYGQALRTAAIKLTGDLPTMTEIAGVTDATSYGAQVDKYLADPRFARQLILYFRDLMKLGGTKAFETAPTFAAELVVNDRPITDLFTATTNTCPTFDATMGKFTDASCTPANGAATVGVLTDPGAMQQFYSNMAFRRVRWVQESFVCTKFPAEYSANPVTKGNGQYVSPWPFTSITGGTDKTIAPINFQDTSSVVCANCHTTMNHIAPLFANFDMNGAYQTTIQVHTPTPMAPITKLSDWLPMGETLSWRYQQPVTDLTSLGAAMAKDPDVADCQVARAWNWAMSKTDIVGDLATVPTSVIQTYETQLAGNGYKLKPVLRAMFTSDDFVKF
ncbi:MAG TPA: hypothetical protein VFF06_34995 [Polyangia bacterium]|nr:hypothetical protein [Polyangia bacterium]